LFRKKNTEKSLGGDTSGESVTTFYRYDKKKKLGEGAFAEVFKAQLVVPRKHGTAEDYAKVVNEDGTFRYNDLQKSSDMKQDVQYALKIIDRSKVEDMNDIQVPKIGYGSVSSRARLCAHDGGPRAVERWGVKSHP